MEGIDVTTRTSIKSNSRNHEFKDKFRICCLNRVKERRAQLLWKLRFHGKQSPNGKINVESALRGIVSDELQKIRQSSFCETQKNLVSENNDMIWEYDGLHSATPVEVESEELMIEMERLLYEDLRQEVIRRELQFFEDEDEYFAQAVFENMSLNSDQIAKSEKLWCPICIRGYMLEAHDLIFCSSCELRLDLENDKANLDFLRSRLSEVHDHHFDKGCKATPKFCMQTIFSISALYVQCEACKTFEIVI